MQTKVCEMFGIEFPILAFTHCRDVVAAVTKAGGMGVLGAAGVTPEQLDIDLRWITAEVGDRPFGVDVIVPAKYEGKAEGGLSWAHLQDMIPAAHRAFLEDLLARYEVGPLPDHGGAGGSARPFPRAESLRLCPQQPMHQLVPGGIGEQGAHRPLRIELKGLGAG